MSKFIKSPSMAGIERIAVGDSVIHRLDPRVSILFSVAFSFVVASSDRFIVLGAAMALAIVAAFIARLGPAAVLKRLMPVNAFMLMLFLILPFSMPGTALMHIGPLVCTREGLLYAASITLKGNAIVLMLAVFLGTMEIVRLGHALVHLHVPGKLAHLFLFTVRYIEVLHGEYLRLNAAMKVRCFQPRLDRHTCRALGNLVGMLLVKSLDRSERIHAAMKCRGFNGQFHTLCHFTLTRTDLVFSLVSLAILFTLIWAQWICRIHLYA